MIRKYRASKGQIKDIHQIKAIVVSLRFRRQNQVFALSPNKEEVNWKTDQPNNDRQNKLDLIR